MADDRHVRRTRDDYANALSALLPSGIGWQRTVGSVQDKVVRGLAGIWEFIDGRIADFLERESDPRQTIELLPEWERAWGLPDACMSEQLTISARRAILMQRMTTLGAQDRQFFIDRAAELGYTIHIVERLPWQFGVSWVGDTRNPLINGGWPRWEIGVPELRYSWFIQVTNTGLFWWRFGEAEIGIDPHLRFTLATDLECIIKRWKPAHTVLIFDYSHVIAGPDFLNILRVTEPVDRAAIVAVIIQSGALAATEAPDRMAIPGIDVPIAGPFAATEPRDIASIISSLSGTLAAVELPDTWLFFADDLTDELGSPLLDEVSLLIFDNELFWWQFGATEIGVDPHLEIGS